MINKEQKILTDLSAEAIWESVYGKALDTKKAILEYIEIVRRLSKEGLTEVQLAETYHFIDEQINALSKLLKANTIVYLKNQLKANLGKFSPKGEMRANHFLEFFKNTYPEHKRTREYTFVLADMSKINDIQVLETLKTINTFCLKDKLSKEQKEDILPMIERLISTQHLKYINQVKSMEGIRKRFSIKIIEDHEMFHIKKFK